MQAAERLTRWLSEQLEKITKNTQISNQLSFIRSIISLRALGVVLVSVTILSIQCDSIITNHENTIEEMSQTIVTLQDTIFVSNQTITYQSQTIFNQTSQIVYYKELVDDTQILLTLQELNQTKNQLEALEQQTSVTIAELREDKRKLQTDFDTLQNNYVTLSNNYASLDQEMGKLEDEYQDLIISAQIVSTNYQNEVEINKELREEIWAWERSYVKVSGSAGSRDGWVMFTKTSDATIHEAEIEGGSYSIYLKNDETYHVQWRPFLLSIYTGKPQEVPNGELDLNSDGQPVEHNLDESPP